MRWKPERSFLDHLLAAGGAAMAAWCACLSLSNLTAGQFFVIGIFFCTFAGYGLSRLMAKTKAFNSDAWLFCLVALFCLFNIPRLNPLIPGEGFELDPTSRTSTFLCWMLLTGGLFAWRDQTLLFLNIPSLALFGLLGVFDNYRYATMFFFVYIVLSAVLYARVHQRGMIERAAKVGASDLRLLRGGAWKWMAGPEWALASALSIVLLSWIGAPVIQASVQPVAGAVRVNFRPVTPPTRQNRPNQVRDRYRIGRGPIEISEDPVMKIDVLDPSLYFKTSSFATYTGSGWASVTPDVQGTVLGERRLIDDYRTTTGPYEGVVGWPDGIPPAMPIEVDETTFFEIKLIEYLPAAPIPAPGPITEIVQPRSGVYFTSIGQVVTQARLNKDTIIQAVAATPSLDGIENRASELPDSFQPVQQIYNDTSDIPTEVVNIARRITADVEGDYEKAMAIKRYIETTCRYNLNAAATPPDTDPVLHFLLRSKEGYCDLFASAMATLARAAGLETQYSLGYIINTQDKDADGYYTIREKDYHAWCEIYFEGLGWVPFDPTEGAQEVAGAGVGSLPSEHVRLIDQPWFRSALMYGAASMAVLAVLLYLISMLRQFVKTGSIVQGELLRHHSRFVMGMERFLRSPKRFSQTTNEFVRIHETQLGECVDRASVLTKEFERAMFGSKELSGSEVRELGRQVSEFLSSLKQARKEAGRAAS